VALAVAALLAALLAAPGAALAGSGTPSAPSFPSSTTTTTQPVGGSPYTVANPSTSSSGGGLSSGDEIGIIVAGVLLIGGIARFILRDSRGLRPGATIPGIDRPRGTARPLDQRVKRSRAKAKQARRARRAGR